MSDASARLRIAIVSPAAADSQSGNGVTARRWQHVLRQLGHEAQITRDVSEPDLDVLVALHARKSAVEMSAFRQRHPARPILLALTGTDLYGPLERDEIVARSLEQADRLIVLQPHGIQRLPIHLRERTHVIRQSVEAAPVRRAKPIEDVRVVLLAHLREVKDPLLTAAAARLLPEDSRIQVRHFGSALNQQWAEVASRETRNNSRYEWLGECSHDEALAELAGSDLMVLTSKSEGGANVVSEAIVLGVPVLSTRIDGSIGMLGDDYEGYFPVGDAFQLAVQLRRAETDPPFLQRLRERVYSLRDDYDPRHEVQAWRKMLQSLATSPGSHRNA